MFENKTLRFLPYVLLVLTVVVGTIGYNVAAGESAEFAEFAGYGGFIASLALLVLSGPIEPTNALIEAARFLGVVFALDIVFTIVESRVAQIVERGVVKKRAKRDDAIAVHGDGVFAQKFADNLGEVAVLSDADVSFDVRNQVLLFSSDELAVDFLARHGDRLRDKNVYVCFDHIVPEVAARDYVHAFSMAGTCAQLYWQKYPVDAPQRIAFIGEGSYAQALLTQALLVNLFDVRGGMEYWMYGNFSAYRSLHHQLDAAVGVNGDSLVWRDVAWNDDLANLELASRVIVCSDSAKNLAVASALRLAGFRGAIYVRCDTRNVEDYIGLSTASNGEAETIVFGTTEELCTQAVVIQQEQFDGGKKCDAAYLISEECCRDCDQFAALGTLAGCDPLDERVARWEAVDLNRCLSCPTFLEHWRTLGEFLKQSNYAAAAFDGHRLKLLAKHGVTTADLREKGARAYAELPQDARDELQEIEHLRWSRFYYLNNWRHGDVKDNAKREHPCLVPYRDLPETDQGKDGDSYAMLVCRLP